MLMKNSKKHQTYDKKLKESLDNLLINLEMSYNN